LRSRWPGSSNGRGEPLEALGRVSPFGDQLRGELIAQSDAGYTEIKSIWNAHHQRKLAPSPCAPGHGNRGLGRSLLRWMYTPDCSANPYATAEVFSSCDSGFDRRDGRDHPSAAEHVRIGPQACPGVQLFRLLQVPRR
jgi:hypothetical protein